MDTTLASRASERLADSATARAIAWLTAWDSQGVHRTATVGDEAGAHWLIREASSLGAAPAVETFALDRLDPIDAYLEFDGTRVPGVPVFDAPAGIVKLDQGGLLSFNLALLDGGRIMGTR